MLQLPQPGVALRVQHQPLVVHGIQGDVVLLQHGAQQLLVVLAEDVVFRGGAAGRGDLLQGAVFFAGVQFGHPPYRLTSGFSVLPKR
nr:MAG TPA: hypothetical protein [Caudoviricetes sp.]